MAKKIGFIGAGRMAEALISGILDSKMAKAADITVSDKDKARTSHIKKNYKVTSTTNKKVVEASDVIVLAVKPNNIADVVDEIAKVVDKSKLLISIAAGIKVETIRKRLPDDLPVRIVRIMPNTPALVLEGATGIYFNENCAKDNKEFTQKIFDSVGVTTILEDEKLMDAVTALSGSGPAYVLYFIEALSDAGVSVGLSRDMSQKLAMQTVLGAAKMVKDTGIHPTVLKEMVTSPGGTTIAALRQLETDGVKGSIINAVNRAYKKSRKLSKD